MIGGPVRWSNTRSISLKEEKPLLTAHASYHSARVRSPVLSGTLSTKRRGGQRGRLRGCGAGRARWLGETRDTAPAGAGAATPASPRGAAAPSSSHRGLRGALGT